MWLVAPYVFRNLSAFYPANHACYTLSEMVRYNWRQVLVRDFGVLVMGTALIVIKGVTGNGWGPPTCHASAEELFSCLAILASAVVVVEAIRWMGWRVRGVVLHGGTQSQTYGDVSPTTTEENGPSPEIQTHKANIYYWKFAITAALILGSVYLGAANPCEPLRLDSSGITVFVKNLALVCGFLLMLKANPLET